MNMIGAFIGGTIFGAIITVIAMAFGMAAAGHGNERK